jgi:hypothetical protein
MKYNVLANFIFQRMKPKFCLNCKYITENGKCSLFPKENDKIVNYIRDIDYYHYYCPVVRDNERMCGPEGKMYVKKDITFNN